MKSGSKNQSKELIHTTPFHTLKGKVHYPQENPEQALECITRVMQHVGLFDGIDSKKK